MPKAPKLPSLPPVVAQPLARGTDFLRETVGSLTWGPALAIAKPAIIAVFSRITRGTLVLTDEPSGARNVYGQKLATKNGDLVNGVGTHRRADSIPRVDLVIKRDAFWMRLFLFADMGFSEAYMLGDIECANLPSFFQVRCEILQALPFPDGGG